LPFESLLSQALARRTGSEGLLVTAPVLPASLVSSSHPLSTTSKQLLAVEEDGGRMRAHRQGRKESSWSDSDRFWRLQIQSETLSSNLE